MQSQKLLFLLCLCLSGRLVLAQNAASGEKNPFAGDPAAVRAGRKLFADSCEVCHGGGARGGRGPALATGNFRREATPATATADGGGRNLPGQEGQVSYGSVQSRDGGATVVRQGAEAGDVG